MFLELLRKLLNWLLSRKEGELMCIADLFKKKDLQVIPGQVDVIPGCDPSQAWLDGLMPSMPIDDLIDVLQMRAGIHLTYYDAIVSGKFDPAAGYGDANFQLWAIEGYENSIYHLEMMQKTPTS